MANTTGYMGFKQIGYLSGFSPDYQIQGKPIASSNGTAIYRGDPVIFSGGYIIAANTTARIDGVFDGCTYVDSTGQTKWSPYCPASTTATGYVIDAPGALFLAQSNGTAIARADVNNNVSFVLGTGQTTGGGYSGYFLSQATIGTTSTLPFRIVKLFSDIAPSSVNGTDDSSANNMAVVTFNNQDFKSGQTGD